jgi:hypothetical protein
MVTLSTFLASGVAALGLIQGVVAGPFVITGTHTGGVQPRLEIRDLQANRPLQWNLYLLALEAMQAEKQTDIASYYEIAGRSLSQCDGG